MLELRWMLYINAPITLIDVEAMPAVAGKNGPAAYSKLVDVF